MAFVATSTAGNVDAMRVATRYGGGCVNEDDLAAITWEPFMPARQYPIQVAINWIGFYVTVQFRDDQGNLSPVFCDDISIEGSPPRSTTVP
ncbi:MAG: hypothetical protein HGA45_07555 [Chloroflexales bacterium]|nr:hypothetical protein [Chloroflexales bacterium]